MATEWISPTWRMPEVSNQSKFENYSLDFDGSNEYVNTNLTQSGTIAVSCWFYTDDASTQMAFFGAGTTNPYQIRNFGLQNGEYVVGCYTKDLTPNMRGIRYDTTGGSASYTTGQWTHFVGIIEQVTSTNANYYLYENGDLKVQVNDGYREQTTYSFFLGAMNNFGTATQKFNGKIDQLAVFDYVPSQDQISYLYNSGTPINPMAISGQPPVAYYPLGGSSTGSASTLTIPNESVADATVFDFDGSSDFIDLGTTTDYNNGDLTGAIWVKASSSRSTTVYAFSNSGSPSIPGFDFKVKTNNEVQVSRVTDTQNTASGWLNIGFAEDVWQYLAFTYNDSTNSLKLFLNGVLKDTSTDTPHTPKTSTVKLTIGSYTGTSNFWEGELSNAQIWNTTLLDTEIETLFNSGVPLFSGTQPQAANLRAWYPMNIDNATWNGSDWIIEDSSTPYSGTINFQI